nr:GGDEF domain-containing protein [Vibrio sp. S9_S30]
MGYSYAGLALCGGFLLYVTLKDRQKISHLAYHDSLTGLANRAALQNELIKLKRQNQAQFSVLLLDLDGFKLVNDTYGHDVGDHLLKKISARLKETCGETDFIARLGGDEFAIIRHSQEEPQMLPESIIKTLSKPICVGSIDCKVGVSIGVCLDSEYQDSWVDILKAADIAMYLAKSNGGNCYDFFDDAA